MALKDIVDVTITGDLPGITRAGFGMPLILSTHTRNLDLIRYYADLSGLEADGFPTTSMEYKAAQVMFSQEPRPPRVAVGRRATLPTQKWTLSPAALSATRFDLKVNGLAVSVLSGAGATAAAIAGLLKAAIDALAQTVTTAVVGNTLTITANVAGAFHTVAVDNEQRLGVLQDHADPGLAADLNAIALVASDWYGVLLPSGSKAEILALAAWTEAAGKLAGAMTQDTDVLTNTAGNVAATAKAAAYFRTVVGYHADHAQNMVPALFGQVLPMEPGSETWAFKTLRGVLPSKLTETQLQNLRLLNVLHYVTIAGAGTTMDGRTAAGEWIDVIRFRDWVVNGMQEDIFQLKRVRRKVPFTDAGVSGIAGVVRARLKQGEDAGGLDPARPYNVTSGAVADQPKADRDARRYQGMRFVAYLAGAVHVTKIAGTVTT